jgi:hypothetical protein
VHGEAVSVVAWDLSGSSVVVGVSYKKSRDPSMYMATTETNLRLRWTSYYEAVILSHSF